ncbi:MAG: GMC family oxidoreductase N-terminal domain-containing protein, partial [Alphaproteobacteria bacterium]|nr:GMC family oxidoreductase N-terminal domain-containing protein [Alphaproteobacteria bacterium]
RTGARERVLETAQKYPERLRVELDALVTRVLLDDKNRAIGVEYLKGERLYRAHGQPATHEGELRQAQASREVILCGGAFNTPQILMLSGVGPREVLEPLGIPLKAELPGVGKNLQDRYEVGIINRMNFDRWNILEGVSFSRADQAYRDWAERREGLYTSNGAVLAAVLKSHAERPLPDLFCFALVGLFGGYFPGYSSLAVTKPNYLTWAILKAHTENRAGEVVLRSADPRDTPLINFHYFEEGSDKGGEDLDSVVAGIRFARKLTAKLKNDGAIAEEEQPGETLQSDDELRDYVRNNAWGHHASCTCPIGPRDSGGVLDGNFQVHGTEGLRVVDASVFPRIPGFFIASAVYMIAEKAADVILAS